MLKWILASIALSFVAHSSSNCHVNRVEANQQVQLVSITVEDQAMILLKTDGTINENFNLTKIRSEKEFAKLDKSILITISVPQPEIMGITQSQFDINATPNALPMNAMALGSTETFLQLHLPQLGLMVSCEPN